MPNAFNYSFLEDIVELENMPIWAAYIVAPILVLAFSFKVIMGSDSPVVLAVAMIVCGLLCASVLHAYIALKNRVKGRGNTAASSRENREDAE